MIRKSKEMTLWKASLFNIFPGEFLKKYYRDVALRNEVFRKPSSASCWIVQTRTVRDDLQL